ncbi:ribose transport system ATP-binding protein [Rhizobium leguminosarum]|uniref:Ribose transport system ATP-binding protein n=1 Tax=Rhizobium leguminosarum TaxID=384 RepID=A0AAE2MMB1_RHILE|nr:MULTISPECIES: sugar ABC transporter ATP-binding protein [Rhizobium]MBB4291469.1 ribose transport system ATP-binding protein [Rhizobium leguminosarum]MBB4296166.1 ribose transport system ATP-binding protein [Rhizobium leguminosarum]MBB4308575.1 ribose transport system ATP-binding protein [Rhizobium leguminosarum]MBB4416410.1 ribose transport system ATP-binding protein [Rhizobium leguminosarum]MBB4430623.1 ribose transport system ATP-binding protein [Rhizobium esperanzae]
MPSLNAPNASPPTPAVRLSGVSKSYGGIKALRDVSFEVRGGEIRALLGENGAGKSTVLKVLCGVVSPDEGSIEVGGSVAPRLTPSLARELGIAMIFQDGSLVPQMTVAQNIFLTREKRGPLGMIDDRIAEQEAATLFGQLGVAIDPSLPVSALSAGQRQLTEIVKAIAKNARVLILDEPSTALTDHEIEHLFTFLRRLKEEGVAIIYVSHRMSEIFRIADSATIMRDGQLVETAPIAGMSMEAMIEKIVGRKGRGLFDIPKQSGQLGEVLLDLRSVSTSKLTDVSLSARAGEVVGVAGLTASGRSALARALFGIEPIKTGSVVIGGKTFAKLYPDTAIENGLMLVPEDRLLQGVFPEHSIADNITLPSLPKLTKWSWLPREPVLRIAREQAANLRIKASDLSAPIRTLSGGNQQKAVLGKWLALAPRILVLDEPTAGIDIGSKSEIVALLRSLASAGRAVLVISSEIPELLAVSDRIVIMHEGRLVRSVDRENLNPQDQTDNAATLEFAERKLNNLIQEAAQAAEVLQ